MVVVGVVVAGGVLSHDWCPRVLEVFHTKMQRFPLCRRDKKLKEKRGEERRRGEEEGGHSCRRAVSLTSVCDPAEVGGGQSAEPSLSFTSQFVGS